MNKNELRKKYKEVRKDNQPTDKIFKRIITLPEYQESQSIALFFSTPFEVDTKSLIEYSLKQNKSVYLPRVVDKHQMVFIKINDLNKEHFTLSKYGIYEPIGESTTDNIDLTIVPGLCFDKRGFRVGYGGGFYDYYLSNHNTTKVGICYDNQITDEIDIDEYDIQMDILVTEKQVIRWSKSKKKTYKN